MRLHRADGRRGRGRPSPPRSPAGRLAAVEAAGLEAVEGLVRAQAPRQLRVGEHVAAHRVDAEEGPSPVSPLLPNGHQRRPRPRPPRAAASASCSTVGCLEERGQGQLRGPGARGCAATSRTASSEWPPSSKKSSRTPTGARPAPPPRCAASCSSSASRGRDAVRRSERRARPGSGRALRSTLPLALRGRAASTTKADGTMYSGSRCWRSASQRRRCPASGPASRTTYADEPLVAGHVLAHHHRGLRDARALRAARPRLRPARCGSRAPSPGSRCGPGTPACRPRASAPCRPCGTAARRAAC